MYLRYFNNTNVRKDMKLSEKLKQKKQTPYEIVAAEFKTTVLYVGQIARGERVPKRGKGLEVYNILEKYSTKILEKYTTS